MAHGVYYVYSPSLVAEANAQYDDNDELYKDDGKRNLKPEVQRIHL